MHSRRVQRGVFILEGLNSFAVTLYFYYFYFFTEAKFGFGNKINLILAAANGLVCVPAAIYGGRFAQRRGCFNALKLGYVILSAALAFGWLFAQTPAAHIAVMLVAVTGMCFTWAPLEALVSEGQTYTGLQRNIGIYNVVWAGTAALAYFIGGAMMDRLGLASLFYVPLLIYLAQLALAIWLHRIDTKTPVAISAQPGELPRPRHHTPERGKAFLRMAWLANPFCYIAINTLLAVMPAVAKRLELSTTLAGFCCSLWCFARLGAFAGLWFWGGWHYKFRWLLAAYLALITTFVLILVVPNLAVVIGAELAFGCAIGLIYYSSLYYSMDVGETKGEHGGIHEAAIGFGNFAGPSVGAAWLHFSPTHAHGGAGAVGALLVLGLVALITIQIRSRGNP